MGSLCIHIDIVDHFIFMAVRASYLSAFTEVILGCEIMNNEFKHAIDDISTRGKITIYLHLKKYFCGTLFTRLCFLERPKENHKLGDVCVHGKEGVSSKICWQLFWLISAKMLWIARLHAMAATSFKVNAQCKKTRN